MSHGWNFTMFRRSILLLSLLMLCFVGCGSNDPDPSEMSYCTAWPKVSDREIAGGFTLITDSPSRIEPSLPTNQYSGYFSEELVVDFYRGIPRATVDSVIAVEHLTIKHEFDQWYSFVCVINRATRPDTIHARELAYQMREDHVGIVRFTEPVRIYHTGFTETSIGIARSVLLVSTELLSRYFYPSRMTPMTLDSFAQKHCLIQINTDDWFT
jgi:hypothetical protein